MFQVNEVILVDEINYRILTILGDEVVWICLDDEKAFPEIELIETLINVIDAERLQRVEDPFAEIAYLAPEEGSIHRQKRDKN